MLRFHGSAITSDGGLLAYRELDDVLALTTSGGERLAEARTGKNRRHLLVGLLRQSVFGWLAGYEDVNDADRLCRDPAMRWVVGGKAPMDRAARWAASRLRQPTTAEVRLDNTKQRVSAQRGRASCRFGCQRVGCDRISLPRNPQGRKIATNNFGIREMSD